MLFQLFIVSALTLTAFCQFPSSQQFGGSSTQFRSQPSFSPSSIGSSQQFSSPSQFSSAPQSSSASQFNPSQFSSSQYLGTTPPPKPISPPAQIHYVNIGADLAGDYKFGYDTGKGPLGQSFREETRLPDGTVRGAYGYVDADGKQRVVKYTAGKEGFKVDSDGEAGQATPAVAPRPQLPQSQPTFTQPAPQTYSVPQTFRQPAPATFRVPSPVQTIRQALPQSAPTYQSLPQSLPASQPSFSPSYPQTAPQQTFRSPQSLAPTLSTFRSPASVRPSSEPQEENYGPPVINTALLSYNIGSQQG